MFWYRTEKLCLDRNCIHIQHEREATFKYKMAIHTYQRGIFPGNLEISKVILFQARLSLLM